IEAGADQHDADAEELLPEVAADARDAERLQAEVAPLRRKPRAGDIFEEARQRARIAELQDRAARVLEQRQQVDRADRAEGREAGAPEKTLPADDLPVKRHEEDQREAD